MSESRIFCLKSALRLECDANRVTRKHNRAIIATDVKRFGHAIKKHEVFGTHREHEHVLEAVQQRLDKNPLAMRQRRETAERTGSLRTQSARHRVDHGTICGRSCANSGYYKPLCACVDRTFVNPNSSRRRPEKIRAWELAAVCL